MIRFTNWLDDFGLPWLCKWIVGWPRYRLGVCPACASDPSDSAFPMGDCPVCQGKQPITVATWGTYKRAIHGE